MKRKTNEEEKKIENFKNKYNSCIFDLPDSFFTDICYEYNIPDKPEVYLEERIDKFYVLKPFCPENCDSLNGFNCEESTKLLCQCPIKIKNDYNSNNININKEKYNKFLFPNIFILKCINDVLSHLFEDKIKDLLFSLNFLLLVVYSGAYIIFKRNLFFLKYIICSFLNIISCKKCFKDKFKDLNRLIMDEMKNLKGNDESLDSKNENENISSSQEHEYKKDEKDKNFKYDSNLIRAYDDDADLSDPEKENLIDPNNQQKEQEKKSIIKSESNEDKKSAQANQINIINTRKELIKEDEKENKKDDLIGEDKYSKKEELNTENNLSNKIIFNQNNDSLPKEIPIDSQIINVDSKLKSNQKSIKKSDRFSNGNNSEENNKNNSLLTLNSNNKKKENNNEENNINIFEEQNKKTQNNLSSTIQININKRRNLKNIRHKPIEKNKNLIDEDKKNNEEEQKNAKNEGDKDDDKDKNSNKENDKLSSEKSIFKLYNQNPYDIDSENNNSYIKNSNGNQIFDEPSKINDLISKESEENQSQPNTEENGKDLISNIEISNVDNSIDKKNENKENLDSEALDVMDLIEENNLSQDNNDSKENSTIINNNFIVKKNNRINKGKKNANPPIRGNNNPYKGEALDTKDQLTGNNKIDFEKSLKEYKKSRKYFLKKTIDRVEYSIALDKDKRSFWKILVETFLKNNTLMFIICFCQDNDDFYAKITVAILTIYLYIFVNIILLFNSSELYLYMAKKYMKDVETKHFIKSFFVNAIIPYIILIYPINNLKKYVSVENKIDDIFYKTYDTLIGYCNFKLGKKKKKDKLNDSEANLKIHNIETEISLTRNANDKRACKLFFFGVFFIIFNWYYLSCFCYIYPNSVEPLFINIIISIIFAFFISFIPYLIYASCRKAAITNKNECLFFMSNLLNPQYEFCKKGKTKKKIKDKINKRINVKEN